MSLVLPQSTKDEELAIQIERGESSTEKAKDTNTNPRIIYLPAFGGEFQAGLYKSGPRKFANPAPLGLCSFALTTFVLSLINFNVRDVTIPNIVVGMAYAYGGFVQILAGMWEMAVANTFGATALTSYGAFWISWAIIQTPWFGVVNAYSGTTQLNDALGFYLIGWFIFTTILVLCTVRSTIAFCSLFVLLDITFILLAISHFKTVDGKPDVPLTKAAGIFGLLTAFVGWWNAYAGLADKTNSFFTVPVVHFPWSVKPSDKSI